jgi:23S rRNA pseudouridine1911/1915/1917 synthase
MKKDIIKLRVKTEEKNRLDLYLAKNLENLSRTQIKKIIMAGHLKINDQTITEPSKKISIGDSILLEIANIKKDKIFPQKVGFEIIHEDEDIVLINKPPGLVVHPGAGNLDHTLVNGLLYLFKNNLSDLGGNIRPGIVHRIDKGTSGVIVVAKNNYCHSKLSSQFEKHTIKRKYEALIWGVLRPLNGKIENKIGRSNYNRQKMAVRINKGKKAITNYKTIKVFQNKNVPTISLVELILETGRTHQIRVQMAHKGNPVLGDKIYGGQKLKFKNIDLELEKKIKSFNRQALHAQYLEFFHPKNGNIVKYQANQPEDFKNLIDILKKLSKT